MKLSKFKDRKAISPVIATVILVAVAITIAVAVSYWMGGIAGQYTKFEKVEIKSAQCVKLGTAPNDYWNVTLTLKNTGSATSTLNGVYVNDHIAVYGVARAAGEVAANLDGSVTHQMTIASGAEAAVKIIIATDYASLSSGTTVNIKIHSAGGMDYIKLIELV